MMSRSEAIFWRPIGSIVFIVAIWIKIKMPAGNCVVVAALSVWPSLQQEDRVQFSSRRHSVSWQTEVVLSLQVVNQCVPVLLYGNEDCGCEAELWNILVSCLEDTSFTHPSDPFALPVLLLGDSQTVTPPLQLCTLFTCMNTVLEKHIWTHVRFEVFTAVTMKNGVFWAVTPRGSCKNRCFGGT
jgi:hypothetical protein